MAASGETASALFDYLRKTFPSQSLSSCGPFRQQKRSDLNLYASPNNRAQSLDFSESKKGAQNFQKFLACQGAQDQVAALRQSFAVVTCFEVRKRVKNKN
jgi:hypothetical protein